MDAGIQLFFRTFVAVFFYYVAAFAVVTFVKPLWLIPRIAFGAAFLVATGLGALYVSDHQGPASFFALVLLGALALWYAVRRIQYHEGLLASISNQAAAEPGHSKDDNRPRP